MNVFRSTQTGTRPYLEVDVMVEEGEIFVRGCGVSRRIKLQ